MLYKVFTVSFILMTLLSLSAFSQETRPWSQLDPRPYNPETDPDIDMYIGSWRDNYPNRIHGNLVTRDVLTLCDGDPMNPPRKGAVLKYVNRFVYAVLERLDSTLPVTLEGEQEIYYCLSGSGTVTGGGESYDIYPEVSFLIPEGMEFIIKNTGTEPLTFYMVAEQTYKGFKPNDTIVWHDEALTEYDTTDAHWVNCNKFLIGRNDGLADQELVLTVRIHPNTFAQPHSHDTGVEEVWCTIEGEVHALIGKEIRDIPPGTAYLVPPNGTTPHANFNVSDKPAKFFYFARGWRHGPEGAGTTRERNRD